MTIKRSHIVISAWAIFIIGVILGATAPYLFQDQPEPPNQRAETQGLQLTTHMQPPPANLSPQPAKTQGLQPTAPTQPPPPNPPAHLNPPQLSPTEPKQTSTPPPNPTLRPPSTSRNICNRTPEIQVPILAKLNSSSCRMATPEELLRIRRLEIETPHLSPGDLAHLHNLLTLSIRTSKPVPEQIFTDLHSLEWLTLNLPDTPQHRLTNVLQGLTNLKGLEINVENGEQAGIAITDGDFKHTPQLTHLSIDIIISIDDHSLDPLQNLQNIDLSGHGATDKRPSLPSTLFANLPFITQQGNNTVRISNFLMPETLELLNHETLCRAQRSDNRLWDLDPSTTLTVGDIQVTLLDSKSIGDQRVCSIGIGTPTDSNQGFPEFPEKTLVTIPSS